MSPTGETGTSSTPPRANAPAHGASKIESTPNSRGAAVVSENISLVGVKVNKVRPWIQRDIEQAKECKADAMLQALLQHASSTPETKQPELLQKCLKAVLPVCNGQVSTALAKSSDVETALKEYMSPGDENHFYGPFIRATNIALACLEEIKVDGMGAPVPAVDMICQQNDMPMHQTHQTAKSIRKPDLVILPLNSACAPFEKKKKKNKNKDDEKDDKKRNKKRKAHMDTNATRKTPGRKKGIQPPLPSSYKVEDYVPTKPEYLPVDHLKSERPAPGPSQTRATQPASDTALLSSGLTAAQPSQGGSSSKRKAADTLESAAKKSKMNPDDTDAEPDVTVQTGLYAAEMFAANLAVNYLLNLIIVDDVMWIWYYDRQGTIQSSGINFIQDLPRFMVLLYALQRFKLEDWVETRTSSQFKLRGKRCHEFKITDEELGEVDLLLHTSDDERVTHYGLQGRATNVVPVTSEALAKKYPNIQGGMVAKIFWGEVNRISEPKILDKVKEIAQGARHLREALGVPDPTTGSRVLYILIFPKLYPITKLQRQRAFRRRAGHVTLWKEGVYHRDVSPGNMMWYEIDGKLMGVLNDYDLSRWRMTQVLGGNERTGTVPFMALDLLTEEGQRGEVKHLYRHDLESFVWCLVWISLRYENGALLPAESRPFDDMGDFRRRDMWREKRFKDTESWVALSTPPREPSL
ncbi:hypothetical protein DFJ58DRAFT_751139 [Suillus subalutaceus]|uniref:uncharacterized protein n=1 Tax=Suillus subalutaceus TaxID=48586 RepID=UPI001B85E1A5|nr:uncharacterized protein DFJ58DRAFT_751139 [Suillus subalutaceus]KAG1826388.1 hypothetical protein DFJ58DRAFT_751139 [Suillus subalutaceus]